MSKIKLETFERPTLMLNRKTTKIYKTHFKLKSKDFTSKTLVPITFDVMFKTMFANTNRKKYVCRLLSYVFDMSEQDIKEKFVFRKNELNKDNIHQKGERVDLVGDLGKIVVNVEMNKTDNLDRNMEYLERISREDIVIGSSKQKYKVNTAQINLNDFCYKGDSTVNYFWFKDENGRTMNHKVLINICIPLVRKKLYTCGIESLDELERYVCMMAMESKREAENIAKGDELLMEYVKDAKLAEKKNYFKDDFDFESHYAIWYKEEGRAEGRAEGRVEAKINSAKVMYELGLSFDDIIKYLSLNKSEQSKIKKRLGI